MGNRNDGPCIVVDLGTATTYDAITSDGVYLGGAIAPGLELGAEALAQRAAQLPAIELSFPSSIIGRTTVESMQSGILFGGLAQLEGFVTRLRQLTVSQMKSLSSLPPVDFRDYSKAALLSFPISTPILCSRGFGLLRNLLLLLYSPWKAIIRL